jgi:hypothetical protein
MFISRTAMKLPFVWGIKQHKHFSKYFQRFLTHLNTYVGENKTNPNTKHCHQGSDD